jgi:hypothetical protein
VEGVGRTTLLGDLSETGRPPHRELCCAALSSAPHTLAQCTSCCAPARQQTRSQPCRGGPCAGWRLPQLVPFRLAAPAAHPAAPGRGCCPGAASPAAERSWTLGRRTCPGPAEAPGFWTSQVAVAGLCARLCVRVCVCTCVGVCRCCARGMCVRMWVCWCCAKADGINVKAEARIDYTSAVTITSVRQGSSTRPPRAPAALTSPPAPTPPHCMQGPPPCRPAASTPSP